jgi:hypothetical protein
MTSLFAVAESAEVWGQRAGGCQERAPNRRDVREGAAGGELVAQVTGGAHDPVDGL